MKAAFQSIHGAAQHPAVLSFYAVFHGDQGFGIFGRDSEYAGKPAPEHGPRAAQGDGRSHADNVSRSDGGGQGGGQRAELADVAGCIRIRGLQTA